MLTWRMQGPLDYLVKNHPTAHTIFGGNFGMIFRWKNHFRFHIPLPCGILRFSYFISLMEPPRNLTALSHSFASYSPEEEEEEEEEIDIYFKVIKTVALRVKRSETVKSLKEMLREKEGIPENFQELFFAGDRLKDGLRLHDCGINKNSTLHLFLQNLVGMELFIEIPSRQKTIMLEVKNYETIQNIKTMIQTKEGIQSDQFSLFYAGKQLKDDMNLASLDIKRESTLHLVFNPRDVLSICVKTQTGNIKRLDVNVLYTVWDIKTIVGGMIGVSARDLRFTHARKELEECKTLAYYGIKEGSTLEVLPPPIQIFVKTTNGKFIVLDVKQEDTVKDLKEKIFQKSRLPVNTQRLFYAGKLLKEGQVLASYDIQKDSTICVSLSCSKTTIKMPLSVLGMPLGTTIGELKIMLYEIMLYPIKEVYFIGEKLQDEFTLEHYKIHKNSKVVVTII